VGHRKTLGCWLVGFGRGRKAVVRRLLGCRTIVVGHRSFVVGLEQGHHNFAEVVKQVHRNFAVVVKQVRHNFVGAQGRVQGRRSSVAVVNIPENWMRNIQRIGMELHRIVHYCLRALDGRRKAHFEK